MIYHIPIYLQFLYRHQKTALNAYETSNILLFFHHHFLMHISNPYACLYLNLINPFSYHFRCCFKRLNKDR